MHIVSDKGLLPDLQYLLNLRFQTQSLQIKSRHKVNYQRTGDYLSNFKGRGINFAEVRPYQPGDDIRHIDWKITARTGKPFTKLFQEERERPVFILVDLSNSMQFGTRTTFKSIIATQIAAILAWIALDNKDRIGGFIFSEYNHKEIRPMGSRRGVLAFIKSLTDKNLIENSLENELGFNKSKSVLNQYLKKLRHVAKPGSLVYIISDFNNINENDSIDIIKQYSALGLHNQILNINIYDPLEKSLPRGVYNFSDGVNELCLDTNKAQIKKEYESIFDSRIAVLDKLQKSYRISYTSIATNDAIHKKLLLTLRRRP